MKKLILGLQKSGICAAEFLLHNHQEVIGFDDDLHKHPALEKIQEKGLKILAQPSLEGVDQVIVSPGVSLQHPLAKEAQKRGIEIIGEMELALRHLNNKAVGITGTNGKTTVTELIYFVLKSLGKKAQILGNIGIPITSYLSKIDPEDILVVELSSFQLETMSTPFFSSAGIINLTVDHMDRYLSFSHYIQAKCRLQKCMRHNGHLFVTKDVMKKAHKYFDVHQLTIIDAIQQKYGMDENNAIAFCICQDLHILEEDFFACIKNFQRPQHRLAFVTKKSGITFINDSKATNPASTLFALQKVPGSIILLVGGMDKKTSFASWNNLSSKMIKKMIAFGKSAQKIRKEVKDIEVEVVVSLKQATQKAWQYAKKGDTILLSPGCASFDSYQNYEERGKDFVHIVHNLQEGERSL